MQLYFYCFYSFNLMYYFIFQEKWKSNTVWSSYCYSFYDFDYIDGNWLNKFRTSSHRIFTILSFILFIFFLVLAILSVIKKTGVAKTIYYHCYFICYFGALSSISNPTSEKRQQLVKSCF